MKHDFNITMILLAMFFITQIVGLVVIDAYSPKVVQVEKETPEGIVIVNETVAKEVPYGMEPPELEPELSIISIMIAILFATLIFFLLTRLRAAFLIKAWFFFVVMVTMAISLTAIFSMALPSLNNKILTMNLGYPLTLVSVIALGISFILTFFKIIRRNFIVHNLTEILVYPGLASIFVPILNVFWALVLLLLISLYDAYAVWKSKHMVKLAQYQINDLKIFTGFFLPYLTNRSVEQIKKIKKAKDIRLDEVRKKAQKIRVSLAILGGGDVAFPLIFAGVVMRASSFLQASIIAVFVTLSLLLLFVVAKKEKFYPAMPFLTAGCILGYLATLLV